MTRNTYGSIGLAGISVDGMQQHLSATTRPERQAPCAGVSQPASLAVSNVDESLKRRTTLNSAPRVRHEPVNVLLVGHKSGAAALAWDALGALSGDVASPNRHWVAGVGDALESMRHQPVHLVLYDLPVGDEGLAILEALREAGPDSSIIALAARESHDIRFHLRDNGREELLCHANITPPTLRRIVSRVLERHAMNEKMHIVMQRERLREKILVRIASNAPLDEVLNDLNLALQKEVSCENCVFAIELADASASAVNAVDGSACGVLPAQLGAHICSRLQRPVHRNSPLSGQRRCQSCLQSMRMGGQLLGELDLIPGGGGDVHETLNAYTKLAAELAALAIDRMRASETLHRSQAELRELSAQLMHVQERERQRIAGDLHDVIGQSLSVIKVAIEDAEQHFLNNGERETAAVLTRLVPWVKTALGEVRRISMDLRPATIDDLGILPTLSWFFRELGASCRKLTIEPLVTVTEADVPEALKIVIFRILQEATSNIVKHAQATRVQVNLRCDDAGLHMSIIDDGRGFDVHAPHWGGDLNTLGGASSECRSGLGLSSMRERARISGGRLTLESAPDKGTRLSVSWPA